MKYYIITGGSMGLDESLAKRLMGAGNHIFCISRNKNEKLQEATQKKSALTEYFEYDLRNTDAIPELMQQIFNRIQKDHAEEICLINNAGMLSPIKALHEVKTEEIKSNLTMNFMTPLVITAEFLRLSKIIKAKRKIINISSAASQSPRPQWACYNSSKAGVDKYYSDGRDRTESGGASRSDNVFLSGAYGYSDEKTKPEDKTSFQTSDRSHEKRFIGKETCCPPP